MTWLQRYRVRAYFRNSIWILPLLSMPAALAAVRSPVPGAGGPGPGRHQRSPGSGGDARAEPGAAGSSTGFALTHPGVTPDGSRTHAPGGRPANEEPPR
jgi:hypothetical protein